MTYLTITSTKVLLCFIAALITTVAVRFALKEKRDLWFARSKSRHIITIRGKVGEHLALGYPKTMQGLVVWVLLLMGLAAEIYLILRFVPA